jgi:hypothetical protein
MASTYSTSLKLELIGSGDQSGTWGTTTNTNLGTLLEQAIVGQTTITMTNADYTLSDYNGASDEARNAVIIISGSQNASYSVICPAQQKLYMITNSLSASAIAYFKPVGGSALSIANGKTVLAYCTGSAMVALTDPTSVANLAGGIASQIPYQTAAGSTSFIANGTSGQLLKSNGTSVPSWVDQSSLTYSVPSGGIIMWSGSIASIPSGWVLCDGTNSTPNLRDRFVIGAGSTYSVAATGGSADAVVVSHTHTVTDPGHTHSFASGGYGLKNGGGDVLSGGDKGSVGLNSNTTGISINTAGVSGTNANLPPYYALAFIMKT